MQQERKVRAIIIDDEQGCISNLKHHLNVQCPGIEVVATGTNSEEALQVINNEIFDVAFLDVKLFDDNIFDVIEQCNAVKFEIVFVTAFEGYAVKAFKIAALDYLMKPLLSADIEACYQKIKKRFYEVHPEDNRPVITDIEASKKVILKQGDQVFIIKQEDIYYLKARGFYTEAFFIFHGRQLNIIISKPIGTLEKEYNKKVFYRVHKSYLINMNKVTGIVKADEVFVKIADHKPIPIAKRRVNDFFCQIKYA